MHKIDGAGATPTNTFTKGDPLGLPPVPATIITDDWLNAVQAEIVAVIQGAGISLDKATNAQLAAAITALIGSQVSRVPSSTVVESTVLPDDDVWPNGFYIHEGVTGMKERIIGARFGTNDHLQVAYDTAADDLYYLRKRSTTNVWRALALLWTDRNDGAGSGMDADLLDGQQGSFYQDAGNLNAGTLPLARLSGLTSSQMAANSKFKSFHGGAVSGTVTMPTIDVGEECTAWYSQTATSTSYKFPATGTFNWVLFDNVAATQVGLAAAGGANLATFAVAKTVCIKYFRTA